MILARLGVPATRALIPHVDDLGASLGANLAFLDLARQGHVTCGAVMVPGPWFRHLVEAAVEDPALDIGIHLTLTSEWDTYRWAPISTVSRTSGLIDDDGYFWRDLPSLRRHMVPEAAEAELRAQVERALAAGLRPTHLDAHMAAAMLPGLLDVQLALAREFGLFPVLPRSIRWAPDPAAYAAALAGLDAAGAPVVDHCRGTHPIAGPAALQAAWQDTVAALPPGVTHLALHATTPGDFTAISPQHAPWRLAEHAYLAAGHLAGLARSAGIPFLSTRDCQSTWRRRDAG